MKLLVILLAVYVSWTLAYERYEGYKVLEIVPRTEQHVVALRKMQQVLGFEVDVWRTPRALHEPVEIMVSPKQYQLVVDYANLAGMEAKTINEDVSVLIDRSMAEVAGQVRQKQFTARDDPNSFDFTNYHSYDEIVAYQQAVASTYGNFVGIGFLGNTTQSRPLYYLKIGTPGVNKPALFVDAGIHAREWIAPAVALYFINQLVNGYNTTYKQLLDSIDIYVSPSINPDGYEFSRNTDRLWRKTRSGPRQGCYGVDPNRNFQYYWGGQGTSTNPCSDTYCGPSAFSEPECQVIGNFLSTNRNSIVGYLTLHSYGQYILYPWGYAMNTPTNDSQDLNSLGRSMGQAIQQVYGTRYTVGNSADLLYPAAGASDDYAKSVNIKWSYTIELRPTSSNPGFQLPASQIIPTATETVPALVLVANRIMTGPN